MLVLNTINQTAAILSSESAILLVVKCDVVFCALVA